MGGARRATAKQLSCEFNLTYVPMLASRSAVRGDSSPRLSTPFPSLWATSGVRVEGQEPNRHSYSSRHNPPKFDTIELRSYAKSEHAGYASKVCVCVCVCVVFFLVAVVCDNSTHKMRASVAQVHRHIALKVSMFCALNTFFTFSF
jgi:hypothetical protein